LVQRSAEDVAATLVRLYRARLPATEDVSDPGERPRETRARPVYAERPSHRDRSERPAPDPRGHKPSRSGGKHALGAGGAVWFRLDVGRAKGADPKWLLPMICRTGNLTKADIGAIRVFDHETKFEVAGAAAGQFAEDIKKRTGENVRIEPLAQAAEGGAAARTGGKPDKRTRLARKVSATAKP
jgi:ATP-dependent RNA helicase DeaD